MLDVFQGIDGITSKRMFGGFGFYRSGKIFGIIAEGKLYFKTGDTNRHDFEKLGSKPFVFSSKRGSVTISYYELPLEIMEDKEILEEWIEKALEVKKK